MTAEQQEKARFFAQYWGCKVLHVWAGNIVTIGEGGWNLKHPDFYLLLTPLSMITDEHAVELEYSDKQEALEDLEFNNVRYSSDADFLRKRGYAVTFDGISVEEQVQRGWVKLKS